MKPSAEVEEKFRAIQEKNPGWSSYICFLNLIRGQKYKKNSIEVLFDSFVEKDDYGSKTRSGLIEYANSQTWYSQQALF